MLFCAGMGIGILLWGPAEPLYHYLNPPVLDAGTDFQKEISAFKFSFFHWGLHPWGIYGLTTLAVCFFGINLKKGICFSSFLGIDKLKKSKLQKSFKYFVDMMTILAILFGIVVSFGAGVFLVEGGLKSIFNNIESSIYLNIAIIAVATVCYIISTLRGLNKGIKILSNISMALSFLLMASLLFCLPVPDLLNSFFYSIKDYLFSLPSLSLGNYSFSNSEFLREWTTKYWSWWIAWAPFVGIFVALISKGRTVRELVLAILVTPTLFSCTWFMIFGKAAIIVQESSGIVSSSLTLQDTNLILFNIVSSITNLPALVWLGVILSAVFFINSADSATYTLAAVSMKRKESNLAESFIKEPPNFLQIGWGVLFSVLTALFLFTGGIKILQEVTLITVVPFSILLCFVFSKMIFEMVNYYKVNYCSSENFNNSKKLLSSQGLKDEDLEKVKF